MILPLALLLGAPSILPLEALPTATAEVLAEDRVRLKVIYPRDNMIGAMIKVLEGADRFCRGKGKATSVSPLIVADVPKSDRAARRLGNQSLTEEYRCIPQPAPAGAPSPR
jgi:hypothetical protein